VDRFIKLALQSKFSDKSHLQVKDRVYNMKLITKRILLIVLFGGFTFAFHMTVKLNMEPGVTFPVPPKALIFSLPMIILIWMLAQTFNEPKYKALRIFLKLEAVVSTVIAVAHLIGFII
jgi:hypothetical protein